MPTSATRFAVDRRQRPGVTLEPRAGQAESRSERHPVNVPAGAGLGRVDVRVGVDPEHSARAVNGGHATERAERNRVVATEHQRQRAPRRRLGHARGDELARVVDLREKARPLVTESGRLGDGRLDVSLVAHDITKTHEALLETCVPDRGRPHVDTAAALAQVERCADDGDLRSRVHRENLTTLSRRGEVAQLVEHTAENRGVAGSSPALATFGRW